MEVLEREAQVGEGQNPELEGGEEQVAGGEQAEEKPSSQETRFDKHPRWIEREKKMQELEERLSKYEQSQQPTGNPRLERLQKMGFGENEAKELLEIFDESTESKISPLKQSAERSQIDFAFKEFYIKNPDISEEIGAEMNRLFMSLKPETQKVYANDVSSLDMLLAKAKANLGSDYEKGKKDQQLSIKSKKEAGSFKGTPAGEGKTLSPESIMDMSTKDFRKNSKQIYEVYNRLKEQE